MKLVIRSLFVVATAFAGVASAETPPPAPKKEPVDKDKDRPKAPPPQQQRPEVSAADAEKFLAFFNKVVDAMVANKDDCAKLTKEVNTLIDANVELVKKIQDAKAAKKDLPADTKAKMLGRIKEMQPAMQKCQNDAGFNAAMMRVNKAPPPPPKETKPAEKPAGPPPTKK